GGAGGTRGACWSGWRWSDLPGTWVSASPRSRCCYAGSTAGRRPSGGVSSRPRKSSKSTHSLCRPERSENCCPKRWTSSVRNWWNAVVPCRPPLVGSLPLGGYPLLPKPATHADGGHRSRQLGGDESCDARRRDPRKPGGQRPPNRDPWIG